MTRVGLIPLDSRPVNTIWIDSLARIAGFDFVMYPREKCGTLYEGSKFDDIIPWVKEQVYNLDYLIISTDGLVFGGLVQARKADIDVCSTYQKLEFIRDIKKEFPNLKIYVFDTIMRMAITMLDDESIKYYKPMSEYALVKGKYHFFKKEEDKKRLEELEELIPSHILDTYLAARKRKLAINKYFLEFVKDKIVDHLILLQEDSTPFGIQAIDQEEIINLMERYRIKDKIDFYNGTDEGAAVLLGRIINVEYKKRPKVFIHTSYNEVLDRVHHFEDRPFRENLLKTLKTMLIDVVDNVTYADFVLSIFGEKKNQSLDVNHYILMPINKNSYFDKYIKELNQYIKLKPTLLVDLQFANGGNLELLENVDYKHLLGYSAWNTSSNSLGTGLANAVGYLVNPKSKINKNFLRERIMDDCVYQYVSRRIVNEELLKQNISPYSLKEHTDMACEMVKEDIHKYDYLIDNHEYSVCLPWGRTFEVEIIMKED